MPIDVARPPGQQAGHAGQEYCMGNVGSDHNLGRKRIEQKKQHHDDAAGTDRSDAHEKSANQSNDAHEGERLHGGLTSDEMVFNPFLEKEQDRNHDQQQPHCGLDEIVYAGAMNLPQVHQKSDAEIRAGNTAHGQRQDDFSPYRAFAQVDDAGGNLGEEVAHRVTADGSDGGDVQAKNEHGQQQYAAAQTRQPDQRSNREADQHF